jgi:hypothetical protein
MQIQELPDKILNFVASHALQLVLAEFEHFKQAK